MSCGMKNCGCGSSCKCGMSCGQEKCGCGSSCKCGKGYNGRGMYPDVEKSSTSTLIQGVAPVNMSYSEGSEMEFGAEGGNTCKCGANCKCGSNCDC